MQLLSGSAAILMAAISCRPRTQGLQQTCSSQEQRSDAAPETAEAALARRQHREGTGPSKITCSDTLRVMGFVALWLALEELCKARRGQS